MPNPIAEQLKSALAAAAADTSEETLELDMESDVDETDAEPDVDAAPDRNKRGRIRTHRVKRPAGQGKNGIRVKLTNGTGWMTVQRNLMDNGLYRVRAVHVVVEGADPESGFVTFHKTEAEAIAWAAELVALAEGAGWKIAERGPKAVVSLFDTMPLAFTPVDAAPASEPTKSAATTEPAPAASSAPAGPTGGAKSNSQLKKEAKAAKAKAKK